MALREQHLQHDRQLRHRLRPLVPRGRGGGGARCAADRVLEGQGLVGEEGREAVGGGRGAREHVGVLRARPLPPRTPKDFKPRRGQAVQAEGAGEEDTLDAFMRDGVEQKASEEADLTEQRQRASSAGHPRPPWQRRDRRPVARRRACGGTRRQT